MQLAAGAVVLFSILFPSKMWYAPDQAIMVQLRGAPADTTLVLIDAQGKLIDPEVPLEFTADRSIDITVPWRSFRSPGTYVLLAVPTGKHRSAFIGTPLVIDVREDSRRQAAPGPMVIKVEPLAYAVISTEKGDMTALFYYDVAPNTVANFISLAQGGFYDGLVFHRLIPGFILQGGDPRRDGTGGPGYHIEAEFGARKHEEGVLSMARLGDPIEVQGPMPRPDFANSAGSQFFICVDPGVKEPGKELIYTKTMQLDGRYTAFGRIVEGLEVMRELGKVPVDPKTDRPVEPQVIRSIRILPVTQQKNPYADLLVLTPLPTAELPATMPVVPRTGP